MPAKSKAQHNLMEAALHGSAIPAAKKIRASMTTAQIKDFTATSTKALPKHAPAARTRRPPQTEHRESHSYNWRERANLKRGK